MGGIPYSQAHRTQASSLRGVNVVQVSRALGHHSAAFTLDVYVHLLEGEEAPALDLGEALDGGNGGATHPPKPTACERRTRSPIWRCSGESPSGDPP